MKPIRILNYLLRDTISLTMLGGSEQTNVIPPEAWANLDVRLLPGGDPKAFLATIRRVVNDPNVTVEPQNTEFRLKPILPYGHGSVSCCSKGVRAVFSRNAGGAVVDSGYTENQRYRPLGINSYGFTPYTATKKKTTRNTETMSASAWKKCGAGFRVML